MKNQKKTQKKTQKKRVGGREQKDLSNRVGKLEIDESLEIPPEIVSSPRAIEENIGTLEPLRQADVFGNRTEDIHTTPPRTPTRRTPRSTPSRRTPDRRVPGEFLTPNRLNAFFQGYGGSRKRKSNKKRKTTKKSNNYKK